ncbi:MAG: hypothetical protein H6577_13195 [Lewinellaceae bacterium]|nr:hypothetical protein [Saprospiraceae bacterium]MCB9339080.1 hypothetical protein [Lewinellaceae bacterium]
MRKLQPLTIQIIEEMPWIYDIESDIRYKQGIEKGIEKGGKAKALETAIKAFQKGLDFDFVMELTGLSNEELLKIQRSLKLGKNSTQPGKGDDSHKKS